MCIDICRTRQKHSTADSSTDTDKNWRTKTKVGFYSFVLDACHFAICACSWSSIFSPLAAEVTLNQRVERDSSMCDFTGVN